MITGVLFISDFSRYVKKIIRKNIFFHNNITADHVRSDNDINIKGLSASSECQ